jgi:hypothetical protein
MIPSVLVSAAGSPPALLLAKLLESIFSCSTLFLSILQKIINATHDKDNGPKHVDDSTGSNVDKSTYKISAPQ